jgi:hypothetical protein
MKRFFFHVTNAFLIGLFFLVSFFLALPMSLKDSIKYSPIAAIAGLAGEGVRILLSRKKKNKTDSIQ